MKRSALLPIGVLGGMDCPEGFVRNSQFNCEPEDYTDYLTPVNAGDNPNNPYDGMKAVDNNGTELTYNAELNAWLLSDVENLIEDGGELVIYPQAREMDGLVLSTITTIALAEPTPVGEIILGGVVIAVYAYEVYKISRFNIDEATRDHCTRLFVQCVTTYGYKNMPCASCQHHCNVQGEWDYLNCPLR